MTVDRSRGRPSPRWGWRRAVDLWRLIVACWVVLSTVTVLWATVVRSYASWMAMAGVDPFRLKELLGHADIKMTLRTSS